MKILVFGTSDDPSSINNQFVISISKYYKEIEDQKEIVDLTVFDIPKFSLDVEKEQGIPHAVEIVAQKIDWADFILFAIAERDGDFTPLFQNTLDWLSRIPNRKIFLDKPIFLLSTSNTKEIDQSILTKAANEFTSCGANILDTFFLPKFDEHFESGKGITNNLLRSRLEAKVRSSKRKMAMILSRNN